uniref:Pseudouridine synthase RsuA/RluA-like domain-containing protein n=1 Tax=Quercus lobata TaxID=97700 RepID=A0A7N2KQZ1_QUELO
MRTKILNRQQILFSVRQYSRISPPQPAYADPVIRVSNNIAQLGGPKEGPKPRQLLSLPPFPAHPLPTKNSFSIPGQSTRVTAISWVKSRWIAQFRRTPMLTRRTYETFEEADLQIRPNEVMEAGARVYIPVSVAETRISKRFDTIPSGTLYPNAYEIEGMMELTLCCLKMLCGYICCLILYSFVLILPFVNWWLKFQDSAIIVLNKPPRLPVKGNLPVHNSMDALAAAALSYDYDEGPKLAGAPASDAAGRGDAGGTPQTARPSRVVPRRATWRIPTWADAAKIGADAAQIGQTRSVHRLDRESSGLLLMGRTKESVDHLQWLFSDINKANFSCEAWNDAYEATYQRYWALVIGCPKQKEGLIRAPLSKVLLNDGKTERVILAHQTGLEASQEAITEYRVLGPKINGCSWIELHPLTSRKHQCAANAGVLSCFADLALTYPEDYYIEGQGSLLQ